MAKKDIFLYVLILILAALFLGQWLSKNALINQFNQLQKNNIQLGLMSGIGSLGSTFSKKISAYN